MIEKDMLNLHVHYNDEKVVMMIIAMMMMAMVMIMMTLVMMTMISQEATEITQIMPILIQSSNRYALTRLNFRENTRMYMYVCMYVCMSGHILRDFKWWDILEVKRSRCYRRRGGELWARNVRVFRI